ncbi:jg23425, partial [Pararge aegeria aegeria]
DPEEQMKRKFRAKCLFRALGRLVMSNAYWLIEGVDQYEGLDDVKRRVEQAVRGKAKKKQLLSIKVS